MKCHVCKLEHKWRSDGASFKQESCPGPAYPHLPGIAKYRRIANPTLADRRAHGDAVHAAMQALQRRELLSGARQGPNLAADLAYTYKWSENWKPRRYMD